MYHTLKTFKVSAHKRSERASVNKGTFTTTTTATAVITSDSGSLNHCSAGIVDRLCAFENTKYTCDLVCQAI